MLWNIAACEELKCSRKSVILTHWDQGVLGGFWITDSFR